MKQRKLNVTYRDLERKDYPYIEKIIRDTWNYDSICDRPSTAKQMARYICGAVWHRKPMPGWQSAGTGSWESLWDNTGRTGK